MNASQLLTHFDRLAEAPDAVARLRRFILDLAVRGKLVEQNAGETSAAKLLSLIDANKLSLIKAGAIRKVAELSPLLPDDAVFELPAGWVWERLGAVGYTQTGTTPPTSMPECFGGQTPFVTPSNLTALVTTYEGKGLTEIGVKHSRLIAKNSVLMVCIGSTIGKVNTVDREVCCNQQINTLTPFVNDMKGYIAISLRSEYFQRLVVANAGMGTLPILSKGKWEQLPIPLPPLAEQHRIVAKVDELMTLCDKLEAAQQERERRRDRLAAASLQRLNQPAADATPEEQREHARFHLSHLPRLITRPEQVKQMRQLLVNLSVFGKLDKSAKNDESAEVLLDKIWAEKKSRKLLKSTQKNREKDVDLALNSLPKGWAWTTFESFATEIATGPFGSALHQSDYIDGGIPLVNPSHMIDGRIVANPKISVSEETANALASYRMKSGDVVMARRGEVGRAAIVTDAEVGWLCGTGSFFVSFHKEINRQYVILLLRSDAVRSYLAGKAVGTTMVNLNHGILKRIPIALPPAAEQHRIVAKVDELMALCDKLEAQLTITQTDSRRLLEAVLA